jgi:hypothetical protein
MIDRNPVEHQGFTLSTGLLSINQSPDITFPGEHLNTNERKLNITMKTTPIRITVDTLTRTNHKDVQHVTLRKHLDGRISDEDLAYLGRLTKATTPLGTERLIKHVAELLSGFKGLVQSLTMFPDESLEPSVEDQKELDEALERIKAWDIGRKHFAVSGKTLGVVDPTRSWVIEVLADHSGDGNPFRGTIISSDSDRPATVEDFERFRIRLDGYANDLEYKIPK